MTKAAARTVANVVLVSASVAAAYVIITTPPLRRLAGMASRRWLGASVPMYLLTQVGRAWRETSEPKPRTAPVAEGLAAAANTETVRR